MKGYEFLKPKKDMLIRDPKTKTPLAETGEDKPFLGREGAYWRRRVKDGSCTIEKKQKSFDFKPSKKEGGK